MELELYPKNDRRSEAWLLILKPTRVKLLDDEDELVHEWKPKAFLASTKMPSFFESRKDVELEVGRETLAFTTGDKPKKKLQDYLDRVYIRNTPNAATRILMIGLAWFLGGAAIAGGALYASLQPDAKAIYFGLVLFGIINSCWGIARLCDYPRWKRLSDEVEQEA
ncbi:MAG: hypothetical protein ACRC8S_03815 [Fimbriiglobus sp.]